MATAPFSSFPPLAAAQPESPCQIGKTELSSLKDQKPCVVWLTGLSGAGKSTIATALQQRLHGLGRHTYLLDGDVVRRGLNRDLGFGHDDRVENIRRVGEVAHLMVDAGLIVIAALISPFEQDRRLVRAMVAPGEFFEVFIDTPLKVAEQRDPKGLYQRARRGELKEFTGIDSPYEVPPAPDVRIDTTACSPAEAAEQLLEHLRAAGIIQAG